MSETDSYARHALRKRIAALEAANAEQRARLTAFNQERERVETELRESRKVVTAAELKAEALATALDNIRINADLAAGPEDTSLLAIVELAEAALDAHRAEAPKTVDAR